MDAPALEEQTETMKNILMFACGFMLAVFGITMVLRHWYAAVTVFQGIFPAALAVAGIVVMFAASLKK